MPKLDPLNIGLIITTVITVLAGWASQRAASKTGRENAKEQAELEAYVRARTMDVGTITRQNEEIEDLKTDNKELRAENRVLKEEKRKLEIVKRALIERNVELQDKLREKQKNDEQGV